MESKRAEEASRRVQEVEGELKAMLEEVARIKKVHKDKIKNVTRALGLAVVDSN